MTYIATAIIVKFIQGIRLDERKSDKKGSLKTGGLKELAKVAIIVTRPAWPKTMRIEAIRRLWGVAVINSDSFVVNPVAVKQDSAWNFARDHSKPVNWKAIAPIRN